MSPFVCELPVVIGFLLDFKKEEEKMSEGGERKHYGTFQGVPGYPVPSIGFPQPVPPSGYAPSAPSESYVPTAPPYYTHGYQAIPVVEGRPIRERRLPCCGLGIGWFLFITGFFFAAIPWYAGSIILLCSRLDYREKPGFVACLIAAIISLIVVPVGVTKGTHIW